MDRRAWRAVVHGPQRVRHYWVTERVHTHTHTHTQTFFKMDPKELDITEWPSVYTHTHIHTHTPFSKWTWSISADRACTHTHTHTHTPFSKWTWSISAPWIQLFSFFWIAVQLLMNFRNHCYLSCISPSCHKPVLLNQGWFCLPG